MCLGIQYIHAACNHPKQFMIVEWCQSTNGIACNNLIALHVSMITAPSLCFTCFRNKEAMIDEEYETIKRQLQAEIARIDHHLAKGPARDDQAAKRIYGYRAECEENIVHAKASRDMGIRLFRREQGVWGDG